MGDKVLQREILTSVIKLSVIAGVSCYALTWFLKRLDPFSSEKAKTSKKKASFQLKKLGKNQLKLTEYEMMIASHLVIPCEIDVSWKDIAGLESVLEDISETVIFPIVNRKLLANSRLIKPPKGVLLHGPPGCGKTLIAKATAKEAVTSFINLDISILTDKWYGESQKLVSALFSLAEKLQPCIIFIDEIDSLLRTRTSQDHEATAMMKAQFMFLWDGLGTDPDKVVIVMGATNRPQDLDSAVLRRMPAAFRIPMPDKIQRMAILKLILEKENTVDINYDTLANKTGGFSGSDLHELCRVASLYRVKEYAKKKRTCSEMDETESIKLRPINMDDLEQSLNTMRGSKLYYMSQFITRINVINREKRMQKLLARELLLVIFILYFKKGESLKCFVCRSDVHEECDDNVNLTYSKECPPKEGRSEVYCRKISQTLKFKSEKNPTLIRECAYEKGSSPCYRFSWLSFAKQTTCECEEENCNRGKSNIPSILTITLVSSLLWIFNFLKKDHT